MPFPQFVYCDFRQLRDAVYIAQRDSSEAEDRADDLPDVCERLAELDDELAVDTVTQGPFGIKILKILGG